MTFRCSFRGRHVIASFLLLLLPIGSPHHSGGIMIILDILQSPCVLFSLVCKPGRDHSHTLCCIEKTGLVLLHVP